ncbi:hypothetical protein NQ318_007347 [Aromia moschata]|uniref:Uncharacterized protein n=1 Tax=Aromia moschata TaxID=1265417 RepID=A0AAV8YZL1_9CUCU|nr:hypothetical protein NQ318_007347 [Aromia moschata]
MHKLLTPCILYIRMNFFPVLRTALTLPDNVPEPAYAQHHPGAGEQNILRRRLNRDGFAT